jgi:hypothetical protein
MDLDDLKHKNALLAIIKQFLTNVNFKRVLVAIYL